MKIKQITTNEYTFEQKDMFVFTTTVGCHDKGDFILLSHETNNNGLWRVITKSVVLGTSSSATAGNEWLSDLLNSGEIIYVDQI